jgi:hypothetical protein
VQSWTLSASSRRQNSPLMSGADFQLAPWPQFESDTFRRATAKAVADVVTADDQVLAAVGPAADEHMDMGVVGVPMIDRDPVETGAEVALRVLHQLPREGPKVGHLARVLRRDCEPEMMPILIAPFCVQEENR